MISLIIIGSIAGVVVGALVTASAFVWRARAEEPATKQIAALAASSRKA